MAVWPDSPLSVSARNTLNHWQLDHGDRWPDWLLWPRPHDWHGYIHTEAGTPTRVLEKCPFSLSTKKKNTDIQNRMLVNHQSLNLVYGNSFHTVQMTLRQPVVWLWNIWLSKNCKSNLTLSPAPCWWKWRKDEWKQALTCTSIESQMIINPWSLAA